MVDSVDKLSVVSVLSDVDNEDESSVGWLSVDHQPLPSVSPDPDSLVTITDSETFIKKRLVIGFKIIFYYLRVVSVVPSSLVHSVSYVESLNISSSVASELSVDSVSVEE